MKANKKYFKVLAFILSGLCERWRFLLWSFSLFGCLHIFSFFFHCFVCFFLYFLSFFISLLAYLLIVCCLFALLSVYLFVYAFFCLFVCLFVWLRTTQRPGFYSNLNLRFVTEFQATKQTLSNAWLSTKAGLATEIQVQFQLWTYCYSILFNNINILKFL